MTLIVSAVVIDYHLDNGVEPVVTLCKMCLLSIIPCLLTTSTVHWDTPLALQAYYGAFMSPEIVNDFVKWVLEKRHHWCTHTAFSYAKTVFQAYNGRVKTWWVSAIYRHRNGLNCFRYTFNEPSAYCGKIIAYPFSKHSVYQNLLPQAYR